MTVILINKKAFSTAFSKNKSCFQKILGEEITEEEILSRIISKKFTLKEALNNSDWLLGILLGYGKNNSALFQKKADVLRRNSKIIDFAFAKDRLCKIKSNLSPVNNYFGYFSVIQPVRFMAKIDHPETRQLINKYAKANSKIAKIYKDQDLVDLIISKLNEE